MGDGNAKVAILMGSQSDWTDMKKTADILDDLGIANESRIISAHRKPERLREYISTARENGIRVIVAGAGGAAHLPGVIAAMTTLPVLGVPMESKSLKGMDSLLSIVQMPGGIPVGTLGIGSAGAKNAGLLAAAILGVADPEIADRIAAFRKTQAEKLHEIPKDQ